MEWFYAEGNERRGPVSEAEFNELIRRGQIGTSTQVWRPGWDNWRSWGEANREVGSDGSAHCVQCGQTYPTGEMVQYEGSWVCPNCKPVFFQKVKEGIEPTVAMNYAGFWIRFLAKFVDYIVLNIPSYILQFALAPMMQDEGTAMVALGISMLFSFLLSLAYSVFMHGKYGATLGKMACGLRVVTAEGGPIGYPVAAGRYFAEILSGIILAIGYIIAAFDDEKRTLHDRICNTRVIRRRA